MNNDLQNTTGTQKTKDWTMIYKIILVHRKLKIEQWSTKYYWYTENERLNNDLQNTTGTQKNKDWTMIYKILLENRKLKIEQWSTKYYWYTEN